MVPGHRAAIPNGSLLPCSLSQRALNSEEDRVVDRRRVAARVGGFELNKGGSKGRKARKLTKWLTSLLDPRHDARSPGLGTLGELEVKPRSVSVTC